ncbi:velvet factor [Ephemerocybe angulata]|uniref:Velvet factor n=1 Tax=Ephemerocybe angulata TaxID=980116 RepID=A0A8H6M4F5_9AGAR|nr:velvet factor [Tulosesus angulatus]KAF6751611.1 velvet factor [Tulosesus angulatus]
MFSITDFGNRRPMPFESGLLAQHSTRAELIEIQKADLGRKYARVDRRPLDPPPVVLLKLFQVLDPDTPQEVEREISNYDEIQNVGLICSVDLFPVPPGPDSETRTSSWDGGSSSSGSSTPSRSRSYGGSSDGRLGSDSLPPSSTVSSASFPDDSSEPDEVVHYVNNYPVLEGSKVTPTLVGNTFVQPNVVEYQGKKALVFVFADLAVKAEGHFIIRYRVFDIYSRPRSAPQGERVRMQAECYGGPFRVYSTKEFPGLNASTELTKHLSRWGVRLNIRETERRRRRKGDPAPESSPYTTTAMKMKRRSTDDNDDGYASGDD